MIVCVLLILLFGAVSVQAEGEKEALISRIAHNVVAGVMPLDVSVSASQAPDQRLLELAEKLAAEQPISEDAIQTRLVLAQQTSSDRQDLWDGLKSNFLKGLVIALLFYVVHLVVQKIGEARHGAKDPRLVTVLSHLKTAPYVLAIPVGSMDVAAQLGHALVRERLVARADLLPQRLLKNSGETDGVLVLAQTVKGQLKKLHHRLEEMPLSGSVLSIPVAKGFGPHLNWIADMADGRA